MGAARGRAPAMGASAAPRPVSAGAAPSPLPPFLPMCRQTDVASSELIEVVTSRRKEGRRAISVLWLH
jgi:hypothetical protein